MSTPSLKDRGHPEDKAFPAVTLTQDRPSMDWRAATLPWRVRWVTPSGKEDSDGSVPQYPGTLLGTNAPCLRRPLHAVLGSPERCNPSGLPFFIAPLGPQWPHYLSLVISSRTPHETRTSLLPILTLWSWTSSRLVSQHGSVMNQDFVIGECVLVVSPHRDGKRIAALDSAGFRVVGASDGEEGMRKLYEYRPGVVVMTDDLAPVWGKELHILLREVSTVPTIVLGNKDHVGRAMTIEEGADIYLDSHVRHRALIAHTRLLLKRYNSRPSAPALRPQRKQVLSGDSAFRPTACEYQPGA